MMKKSIIFVMVFIILLLGGCFERAIEDKGTIKGIVTIKGKTDYSGINVTMSGAGVTQTIITDKDGNYKFENLLGGDYTIKFSCLDYADKSIVVSLIKGKTVIVPNNELNSLYTTISGQVVSDTISDLKNVSVRLLDKTNLALVSQLVYCDSNGKYTISKVLQKKYILRIQLQNYKTIDVDVDAVSDMTNIDIKKLESNISNIKGKVTTDILSEDLTKILVSLKTIPELTPIKSVNCNIDGTFEMKGIPFNKYKLTFEMMGYSSQESELDIAATDITIADKKMMSASILSMNGNIIYKDRAEFAKNVTVILYDLTDKEIKRAITDSTGKYIFDGLKSGNYKISVNGETKIVTLVSINQTIEPIFISYTPIVEATSIAIGTETEKNVFEGTTFALLAVVLPENTTDKYVTWTTTDEVLVSVNQMGLVTAKKEGTAIISASTSNGKKAQIIINVKKSIYPPATPVNLICEIKASDVLLKWDIVNYAEKYSVYLDNGTNTIIYETTTSSILFRNAIELKKSTKYKVYVTAKNRIAESGISEKKEFVTKPGEVRLEGQRGDKEIYLSWNAKDGNKLLDKYRVYKIENEVLVPIVSDSEISVDYFTVKNLTNNTTYQFVVKAYNDGGESNNSNVISIFPIENKIKPPMLNVVDGANITEKMLSLSSDTSGSSIFYTLDGSVPTSSSALYTTSLKITKSTTVAAVTYKEGYLLSDAIFWEVAVNPNVGSKLSVPILSIGGGTYSSKQTVKATSSENGIVRYTVDGTIPNRNSLSVLPIVIDKSMTLKVFCYLDGYADSDVVTEVYNIQLSKLSVPEIKPITGVYTTDQSISITSVDFADIYYTIDGSEPTISSTLYNGPRIITSSTTVKAIAVKEGRQQSDTAVSNITINKVLPKLNKPIISKLYPVYQKKQFIVFLPPEGGASVYYILGSGDPLKDGKKYDANSLPIEVTTTTTIFAIAVKDGYTDSDIAEEVISFDAVGKLVPSIASVGDKNINIRWDAVTSAVEYRIYQKEGTGYSLLNTVSNLNTYSIQNLNNSQNYTFVVTFKTKSGNESDFSAEISATPNLPLAPPEGIKIESLDGGVKISWNAVSNANVFYKIYEKNNEILPKTTGDNTITIDSLTNNKTYTFYVTANLPYIEGIKSAGIDGIPTKAFSAPIVSALPLVQSIKLMWPAVVDATKYLVYKADNNEYIDTVTTTSIIVYTGEPSAGTKYSYVVYASNGITQSLPSSPIGTVPYSEYLQGNDPVVVVSSGEALLSWNAIGAENIEYRIYDGLNNLITTTTNNSYTYRGLQNGKDYLIKIAMFDRGINKEYAKKEKIIQMKSSAVSNPIVTQTFNKDTGKVEISAKFTLPTDIANITGYRLYKYYTSNSENGVTPITLTSGSAMFIVDEADLGKRVYFKFSSMGANGIESDKTSERSTVPVKLGTPVIGSLVNIGTNGVGLSWGSISGATMYSVKVYEYQNDTQKYQLVKSLNAGQAQYTYYTIMDLKNGTMYGFTVAAVYNGIEYIESEMIKTTILPEAVKDESFYAGYVYNEAGQLGLKMSWNSALGAMKYRVYKIASDINGVKTLVTETTATSVFLPVEKSDYNVRYYYTVKSVAQDGIKEDEANLFRYMMAKENRISKYWTTFGDFFPGYYNGENNIFLLQQNTDGSYEEMPYAGTHYCFGDSINKINSGVEFFSDKSTDKTPVIKIRARNIGDINRLRIVGKKGVEGKLNIYKNVNNILYQTTSQTISTYMDIQEGEDLYIGMDKSAGDYLSLPELGILGFTNFNLENTGLRFYLNDSYPLNQNKYTNSTYFGVKIPNIVSTTSSLSFPIQITYSYDGGNNWISTGDYETLKKDGKDQTIYMETNKTGTVDVMIKYTNSAEDFKIVTGQVVVDKTSPNLLSTAPVNLETVVVPFTTGTFDFVFDEDLNKDSIKAENIYILDTKNNNLKISCAVNYDETTKRIRANPNTSLVAGGSYKFVFETLVSDFAGNSLAKKEYSFSTQ